MVFGVNWSQKEVSHTVEGWFRTEGWGIHSRRRPNKTEHVMTGAKIFQTPCVSAIGIVRLFE